jgi:hypothetical protein
MMKSILSTRQLATDSALGTPIRNGTRRVCEDGICISFPAKKGQHSIFASFGGYESIQRNFRHRGGIKVFSIVICFVLCIIMRKETQAAVCSERTWRMMKSIPSTRQLATDSTPGTTSCSGTRRVCEDVICISFRGGIDGDFGIEYVRGPDSVIIGWPVLHEHCCMLKSESIRSNEILTRPQKLFLVGVGYPSVTAPVVQGIVVSITGIGWRQLLFEGLYAHGVSFSIDIEPGWC